MNLPLAWDPRSLLILASDGTAYTPHLASGDARHWPVGGDDTTEIKTGTPVSLAFYWDGVRLNASIS